MVPGFKERGGAEGRTYVVLRGAADAARLALDALPLVRPHRLHHVVGELQTRGVTCRGDEMRQHRPNVPVSHDGATPDRWWPPRYRIPG